MASPEDRPTQKVCLSCGKQFTAGELLCPDDGTLLRPQSESLKAGDTFADRYEILGLIGDGGWGKVYKARHKLMKRNVAIKMLLPHLVSSPQALKRFQHEAQAASALNHPNILTVHDFGISEEGLPFLVMDYLEGTSLSALLQDQGRLTPARAIPIFIQACLALAHAHQKGVIHRDIKPANIMLIDFEGQPDFLKLVDFGIAKIVLPEHTEAAGTEPLTNTGDLFGSPMYMSPEQCRGRELDARSDIYALGCVIYRTVTGKPAFTGRDPMECMFKQVHDTPPAFATCCPELGLPDRLEELIMKAVAKDPADRFQSMLDFKDALEVLRRLASIELPESVRIFSTPPGSEREVPADSTTDLLPKPQAISAVPSTAAATEAGKARHAGPAPDASTPRDTSTDSVLPPALEAILAPSGKFNGVESSQARSEAPPQAPAPRSEPDRLEAGLESETPIGSPADRVTSKADPAEATAAASDTSLPSESATAGKGPQPETSTNAPKAPDSDEQTSLERAGSTPTLENLSTDAALAGRGDHTPVDPQAGGIVPGDSSPAQRTPDGTKSPGTISAEESSVPKPFSLPFAPWIAALVIAGALAIGWFAAVQHRSAEPDPARDATSSTPADSSDQPAVRAARQAVSQASQAIEGDDYRKAQTILEQAMSAAGDDPAQLVIIGPHLGQIYLDREQYESARSCLERVIPLEKARFGDRSVEVAKSQTGLALAKLALEGPDAAKPLLEDSLSILESGKPHPDALPDTLYGLARVSIAEGNPDDAIQKLQQAVSIKEQAFGRDTADSARFMDNLGEAYQIRGDLQQAEQLFNKALAIEKKQLGSKDLITAGTMKHLATLYFQKNNISRSEQLFKQALAVNNELLGTDSLPSAEIMSALAMIYERQNKIPQALKLMKQALDIRTAALGQDAPLVSRTRDRYQELQSAAQKRRSRGK